MGPELLKFSQLLNSPAAKQMSRWHLAKPNGTAEPAQERAAFLKALDALGGWPRGVRTIGVANGVGTGTGNGVKAGVSAVRGEGDSLQDTWLQTQAQGEQVVARLQKKGETAVSVRTNGLPEIDGAPGGLFTMPTANGDPGSFGLASLLMAALGNTVDPEIILTSCFIPAISAVAAGDIADTEALYKPIAQKASALDAFICASSNEGHTTMTEELGSWIVNEIVENS
ncbi:hypothetical protein [Streptomyces clavifer]|uniref:hypothetical protein n=1 Tax=Streptomyces clavifer TaxID=68188 RepID=UPI0036A9CBC6